MWSEYLRTKPSLKDSVSDLQSPMPQQSDLLAAEKYIYSNTEIEVIDIVDLK